ncbi:MAG: hypothetical protein L6R37_007856 [Teloschistes peruensis]|nr:MAG: hypothetical protein L6R37_007856 [Teloschistes peruensis]
MPKGEYNPDKILQKRICKARKERREARQKHIIGIINSTWASIARAQGAYYQVDESAVVQHDCKAFPYQLIHNLVHVPASYADFCLLRKFQHLSAVDKIALEFEGKSKTCGRSAVVLKRMPSYHHEFLTTGVRKWLEEAFEKQPAAVHDPSLLLEPAGSPDMTLELHKKICVYTPDASFCVDFGYPCVVVELAKTETEEHMLHKGGNYHHGAGAGISVLLMVKVTIEGEEFYAELWLWKFTKDTARPGNSSGFKMAKEEVCNKVEIFPRDLTQGCALTMTRKDLYRNSDEQFEPDVVINVPLSTLHARLAKTFAGLKKRDGQKPYNPGPPLPHSDSGSSSDTEDPLSAANSPTESSDGSPTSSEHSEYDPKA